MIARKGLLCRLSPFWRYSAVPANAFERIQAPAPKPEMSESCPGLIASDRPRAIPAAFRLAALSADQVRITYAGHSTFLIESPKLVRIATDYNDYVTPPVLPDVVTMNHAHSTHYTDRPDPEIPHVLRGWAEEYGKPMRHDTQIRDVRVRNVPTNIRDYAAAPSATAIRSSFSRLPIFASRILGICITRSRSSNSTRSDAWMW